MSAYVGRFAPTPSGPLHMGSLVTALGSYLCARSEHGTWLIRFDDLDGPRVAPGAEATILRQLEAHGLNWDAAPRRQSEHVDEYSAALARLREEGRIYACLCSRSTLRSQELLSGKDAVYPGHCRAAGHLETAEASLRFRMPAETLRVDDPGLGCLERKLDSDLGDFVVLRRDGQFAYQLASAVDEGAQKITEVVRGADLTHSTFRQVSLIRCLGGAVPGYRHLPLLVDAAGKKLSKRDGAIGIQAAAAGANLARALVCLGQNIPPDHAQATINELLAWAIRNWNPKKIPRVPVAAA